MNNLRVKREAIGITQTELAKRCRCSPSYISAMERGKEKSSEKMVEILEVALKGGEHPGDNRSKRGVGKPIPFADEEERRQLKRIWYDRFCSQPDSWQMKH